MEGPMSLRNLRVSRPIQHLGCGLLALPILWLFVGEFIHVFASARATSHRAACFRNIHAINMGVLQYAADWDETCPPAHRWAALSEKYMSKANAPDVWRCPASVSPFSYASNQAVGGQAIKNIDQPATVIYLFECDATMRDTTGGVARRVSPPRHPGGDIIGFLDGHVKQRGLARWQPFSAR